MTDQEKISTNSPLDELLDGGIEKRTITQVYELIGLDKYQENILILLQRISLYLNLLPLRNRKRIWD